MHYEIVIIGAGLAGLGAAYELSKHKVTNILILEAQNVPGGRASTLVVDEGVLELGAQWVHGIDNELYDFAIKYDLIHPETSDEGLGIYIRDDGEIIDKFLVDKVDFIIGQILECCEDFLENDSYPESVGDYLQEKFMKYIENLNEPKEIIEQIRQLYDWHLRFQIIDNSCSSFKHLSAKEWGRYSCLGKDGQKHLNLKGGHKALIEKLLENLPENLIKFNSVANKIKIIQDRVEITYNKSSKVTANYALLTASISALKHLDFPFNPKMKTAMDSTGFEGMGKVFLVFGEKWWHHEGFQLIWTKKLTKSDPWTRHFSGFEIVLDQPRVLIGWISALGVEKMEKLSEAEVGKQCANLLRDFLKDLYENIPDPVKVFKSSWCSNPYVGGGYSYIHRKSDDLNLFCPEELSKPLSDEKGVPRILLAGEALHSTHFSTTHGAFESGQEQVRKFIDHL